MPSRILTQESDLLDALAYRHYGRHDVLPAVLEANPHIAGLPPALPAGTVITLPDLPAPAEQPSIRLWS